MATKETAHEENVWRIYVHSEQSYRTVKKRLCDRTHCWSLLNKENDREPLSYRTGREENIIVNRKTQFLSSAHTPYTQYFQ